MAGCPNVFIGLNGPGTVSLTPPEIREALSDGAFPGPQHYNNCGVQSVQQLVFLATGNRMSENSILKYAVDSNLANAGNPANPKSPGGTTPQSRQQLLSNLGVQSVITPTSEANLSDAIRNGKGAIVNVEAGTLWGSSVPMGGHAVVVTGGTFDASGKLETVTVNDTGIGRHHVLPAQTLLDAAADRKGGSQMNVTSARIFP